MPGAAVRYGPVRSRAPDAKDPPRCCRDGSSAPGGSSRRASWRLFTREDPARRGRTRSDGVDQAFGVVPDFGARARLFFLGTALVRGGAEASETSSSSRAAPPLALETTLRPWVANSS
jgi:hypothetical protein